SDRHTEKYEHGRDQRRGCGGELEVEPIRIVYYRKREPDDGDGQQERDDGKYSGLADKLPDELPPVRAQHFAHPDLTSALQRTGRGQVDEVDAGDQQND